jgi:hypothetical protein
MLQCALSKWCLRTHPSFLVVRGFLLSRMSRCLLARCRLLSRCGLLTWCCLLTTCGLLARCCLLTTCGFAGAVPLAHAERFADVLPGVQVRSACAYPCAELPARAVPLLHARN